MNQNYLQAVHADEKRVGNAVIKIAVLDSGRDIFGDYETMGSIDLVDGDANVYGTDMTGHGTAVQSVIGAKKNADANTGVASSDSNIEMYSVRILDESNQAPVSRVVQGLQWCMENDIDIVNMSFGMNQYSEILEEAIKEAEEKGMLLVAAVGNNGEEKENGVQYPAAYEQVIGVGSVNESMERSDFSAIGDGVEIVAPGENVPVSSSFSYQAVGRGTSFAAPHISAIAAMVWFLDTDRSNREIRGILQSSARYLGESQEYGYGLVDYAQALEEMEEFELAEWEKGDEREKNTVNDTPVKEYELPEVVMASWGTGGKEKKKDTHQDMLDEDMLDEEMIDSFPSDLNKDLVLQCLSGVDSEYKIKDDSRNAIFHAGQQLCGRNQTAA